MATRAAVPIDQRVRLTLTHAALLLDCSYSDLWRATTWHTPTSGELNLPETPPIPVHRGAGNGRPYIYRAHIDRAIAQGAGQ